ncbi:uncharacterized protein LOC122086962 isoform X3 [Macadamia integrifolia]|uniref:uncharacterized protein LOC122086962 isoform X3 n=1 Tax=Macadamia integrifolia TaxID=60698 RepID=UPI001C4F237F|nr:uncharacterized protein LOC122086962 isoform X3 [Macadamia integrifolia]
MEIRGPCDVISNTFPGSHHRWCSKHLYANLKSLHPGVLLRKHFWKVAKVSNQFYFDKAMNDMKATKKEAFDWLSRNPPNMWARGKPILILIDEIRKILMKKMQQRYQLGCSFKGRVTPKIKTKLDVVATEARGAWSLLLEQMNLKSQIVMGDIW